MSVKMKRYRLYINIPQCSNGKDSGMAEDINGNWVKWVDVDDLMKKLGRCEPVTIKCDSIECTCQKEAEQPTGMRILDYTFYDRWICPLHGYKRL